MEKPIYPSPYMRITQGYMEGTHIDSFAIDEAGSDSGIDYLVAPFTGIIRKIYQQDANEVWLESVDKVEYPDGTIDYMTVLFAHDNDVSNLSVGQVITKGTRFYEEGTKGNASGNHVHIECGLGKFTGTGWHQNAGGYWSINNSKNPTDCFFIDDSITILDSHGYTFKKIEPEVVEEEPVVTPPVSEEVEDTTNDSNSSNGTPIEEDISSPQLIFTCPKTDIYAIELEEGQKLYLE